MDGKVVQVGLMGSVKTGWSAAHLSEFQVFPAGATHGRALTVSPSSESFEGVLSRGRTPAGLLSERGLLNGSCYPPTARRR